MSVYLFLLIAIFLIAVELAYFKVAERLNIVDKPNLRSSHNHITLRGGGVVFLFAAWTYVACFGLNYVWFMTGLTAICIVSFVDDVHSVPEKARLLVQFASVACMFVDLGVWSFGLWVAVPALIVTVGILNAYNFMDGINGITGAYSLSLLFPIMYLNHESAFVDQRLLIVILTGVVVFLFFNFRRNARCFAGDVGSVGVAFIILFALGKLMVSTGDLSYILFLVVYGVDSVLTIVHRMMLHENLGKAHRKHAFQIMSNELKLSHRVVASGYMVLQVAISFGLIFYQSAKWVYFVVVIAALSLAYILFMRKYYPLHEAYINSLTQE